MRRVVLSLGAALIAVLLPSAAAWAQESSGEGEGGLDPEAAEFLGGSGEGEAPAPAEGAEATPEAEGEATPAEGGSDPGEGAAADDGAEAFLTGTEQAEIEAPEEEQGIGWAEPEDMRFWMVGIRYRTIFVPGWLLNAFFDFPQWPGDDMAGPFMVNHAAGVEFTTRRNNFAITGAVWWAGFFSDAVGSESNEFIATEAGDPTDPEFIESTMSLLIFSVDFVHSTMFTDWFGITYGGGIGLGVLFGELIRTEAYMQGGEYQPCVEQHNPDAAYCEGRGDEDDGYYGTADSRVPPVIPWVNLLVGLRFKPMRHLEINIDGGVGVGFTMGARASYIF